ncbi:GIY-YIG nuclease family protein [Pseudomonas sp. N-137]|uniref:GIY-YIG nuclease family protein n=1 Tax=Pseudomonas sp. N-137 TaxID=3108452 RepID=UPI002ADECA81|nr:GIY-YIG nuclease family protein [Pseudomonas sp. N-137]MEA1030621.1 GIY-YIG nuclease family protein [Pseudomonas sp. N-137]
MTSHVYILRHVQHPRFKIGKANNIIDRARNFRLEAIDFSNSLGLSVASEMDAYALEKILQRIFRHASVDVGQVIASGGSRDGASEWFDVSCWSRLMRYLEDNRDLHPHEIVSGKSLALLVNKLLQPTEAALARAQLKKAKEARRIERQEALLAFRREQMVALEQSLRLVRAKLVEELEHHRRERNVVGVCHGRYGPFLVLANAKSLPTKEVLWRLELQDTQYKYHYGGGSLITGYKQLARSEGTICIVSMPRLELQEDSPFSTDRVIYHVFQDELTWIWNLREIPEVWLDAIFPIEFLHDTDLKGEESELAAERLMQAHREAGLTELSPLNGD